MKTSFGKIQNIILFGGSLLLLETAKHLKKRGAKFHVYTSPRHEVEVIDESGQTLAQALSALSVPYVSTADINREASLNDLITSQTLGLGMGEAWSFDSKIIDRFQGRLLDFMGIPLPRYRGGAHYTWMILRGDRQSACNLQVINTDMIQGEVDTGEIVKTKAYTFPESARIPMDYFRHAVQEEVQFIQEFIDEVQAGKSFDLKRPDENQSLYLPRLHTKTQGWIDWSWSGKDIERMICAFDVPYPGASSTLNGKRVFLKGAKLESNEAAFHPFQTGLITRILPNTGVTIATLSGHLTVQTVLSEDGTSVISLLKPGDRFFTPQSNLEAALTHKIQYGSHA